MPSLNYHHLLYFWMVAKEGTIARAAEVLDLAQPTISGQIKALESSLGERLFTRSGRTLRMTETGELVFRYADEIFSLGREMLASLQGRPTGQSQRLAVGISDAFPKVVTHRVLAPALGLEPQVHLVCRQDRTDRLLAELSVQGLDLVLSDQAITGETRVKIFNHLLGETGITFFIPPVLRENQRSDFPYCLNELPVLLPPIGTPLRSSLEQWFDTNDINPEVVAECSDTALMKEFGRNGAGVFPGPSAVESEICREHGVLVLGRAHDVVERFYAVTVERRFEPPAVSLIVESARSRIF